MARYQISVEEFERTLNPGNATLTVMERVGGPVRRHHNPYPSL
jgi:hypothetical protein